MSSRVHSEARADICTRITPEIKAAAVADLSGARAPEGARRVLVNRARFSSASSGGLGPSASPPGAGQPFGC